MNNKKINKELIAGGVDGFVTIICSQIKCTNRTLIKKQILKADDITIKGLKSFDVMDLADVIRYIATGVLEYDNESDYIKEALKGNIMLFGGGETKLEKCQNFISSSDLKDEEKIILLSEIPKSEFYFSLLDIIRTVFVDDSPSFFQIIPFVTDVSVEKEYRLTELNIILKELYKAIDKNTEIIESRTSNHLKVSAKILNKSYNSCLNEIKKNLSEYVNLLGSKFFDIENESKKYIINSLINESSKKRFESYEGKLVSLQFLSIDRNNWLKSSADLVRFYNYCEQKEMINRAYKNKSKGIKLLRKLYNYFENESIDSPRSKRLKQDRGSLGQFNFLDII